jgi:type I restriction enzyme S subunit
MPDDVLLCKINPRINRVWIVGEAGRHQQIASTEYLVLRTTERALARYLRWYLSSPRFRDWITLAVEGATGSHTRAKSPQILRQLVPIPPLAEQRRIVAAIEEHLSRLDAAAAEVHNVQARVDALRRSMLNAAVADGVETELGELLTRIEAGRSAGGPAPRAQEDEWGVIKVSAMTWGEFRPWENKRVAADSIDEKHEIRPGDLLVSRANTTEYVGAAVVVRETRPRLVLSDKSLRLIVRDGVDREWLLYALLAPRTRRQISAVATGTSDSMRNISQEKLRAVRLRVPDAWRQPTIATEISRQLTVVSSVAAAGEAALSKSVALRRAILARAFRGELVPQDPDDEPTIVLLERVAAERSATNKARQLLSSGKRAAAGTH